MQKVIQINGVAHTITYQDPPRKGSIDFGKHGRELGTTFKQVLDDVMGEIKNKKPMKQKK